MTTKSIFFTLLFVAACAMAKAQAAPIEGNDVEVSRAKGKPKYNRCQGPRGKCAIFVAEDLGNGTYLIPQVTSVIYDNEYAGPYLPGTYFDALGRHKIDNVHISFTPSDCIDPETGMQEEGCVPGQDDDMYFNPVPVAAD